MRNKMGKTERTNADFLRLAPHRLGCGRGDSCRPLKSSNCATCHACKSKRSPANPKDRYVLWPEAAVTVARRSGRYRGTSGRRAYIENT
jgi:hypothetical protein